MTAMPVVAVINRKGGSGKSTLATHLAAHWSHAGAAVMLGDADHQQSTQTWLRQRRTQPISQRREIIGWNVDSTTFARPPAGVDHVVLDTPGGLRGLDLARVVMYADAILMPVCNSIFDRESAADCLAELRQLPRISTGRCKVGVVGMRLDARTRAAEFLHEWVTAQGLPFIAVLRESQTYVRCIEKGLTLFDLPATQVQADLAQWQPILQWLQPILHPVARPAEEPQRATRPVNAPPRAPVHSATARGPTPGTPRTVAPRLLPEPRPLESARRPRTASPVSRLLDALPIPRFLQRSP
jgi:chromosome partitioning protein